MRSIRLRAPRLESRVKLGDLYHTNDFTVRVYFTRRGARAARGGRRETTLQDKNKDILLEPPPRTLRMDVCVEITLIVSSKVILPSYK